jgi:hypothetical protein
MTKQGPPSATADYQKRIAAKRAQSKAVKGHSLPVGGAPPIAEGTMPNMALPRVDFGPPDPQNMQGQMPIQLPPDGMPQGVGAAYPVNQHLAAGAQKPVSMAEARRQGLGGTKPAISPETEKLLSEAQLQGGEAPVAPPAPAEQEGPAELPPPVEDGSLKEDLDEADAEIVHDRTPQFQLPYDADEMNTARQYLESPERRQAIEGTLSELDVADLITDREIRQDVEVVPGKIIYTFRTFNEREHLWCLRYVYNFPGSVRYVSELLNLFKLTCSIVELNKQPLPDHRKDIGRPTEEVDEKKFKEKYDILVRYPIQILSDMSIQCMWFDERVTKLLSLGSLKNG